MAIFLAPQVDPHGSCVEASWNTLPAALFARSGTQGFHRFGSANEVSKCGDLAGLDRKFLSFGTSFRDCWKAIFFFIMAP
jgi:hypothetical protein